jgi:CHAT domain-containing protein
MKKSSSFEQSCQDGQRLATLILRLQVVPRDLDSIQERIRCCQEALELLGREDDPRQWAQLHFEQGLCLATKSPGTFAVDSDSQEQAIAHFEQARLVYTPSAYFDEWVDTTYNLAHLLGQRIHDNKSDNIDQAIRLIKEILETTDRRGSPQVWAKSQAALGRLYYQRVNGERAENLDRAEQHCRKALMVWTAGEHPVQWAKTQDLLGTLHRRQFHADPADSLEVALEHHRAALTALEPFHEHQARDWARMHHNVGITYLQRLTGSRAENLERAIGHFAEALAERPRETFPRQWADTSHSLAAAYIQRWRGDRNKSIECAIEIQNSVLDVYRRESFPVEWAMVHNVLGDAYMRSVSDQRAENIERAIECYEHALEAEDGRHSTEGLALTHINLAAAYGERLLGIRIRNLAKATEHGRAALSMVDKRALTTWALVKSQLVDLLWKLAILEWNTDGEQAAQLLDEAIAHGEEVVSALEGQAPSHRWALAHYNLGNVYGERFQEARLPDQEESIEHYEQALRYYSEQDLPVRWADTHNNLGVAYCERKRGIPTCNRQKAFRHFERALAVYEPHTFPGGARRTARNLGNLHFQEHRWDRAHAAFNTAITAGDTLYQTSVTEVARQAELAEATELYANDAYCLARTGCFTEAVERLEAGRARALAEALARDRAALDQVSDKDRQAFEAARDCVNALSAKARAIGEGDSELPAGRFFTQIADELRDALQVLAQVTEGIRTYLPGFMPTGLPFKGISAAAIPLCPLVYLITTQQGSLALIVPPGAAILDRAHIVWLDDFDDGDLAKLLWQTDTSSGYLAAQVDADIPLLKTVLGQMLPILGQRLMGPLCAHLTKLGFQRMTLVPCGRLSLLPLHAATYRSSQGERFILDDFEVAYAPSARALAASHETAEAASMRPTSLLAIVDPPHNKATRLAFARTEVEDIRRYFPTEDSQLLCAGQATADKVSKAARGKSYLHFACHGLFDPMEPLRSALLLAGRDHLTLRDILDNWQIKGVRLVTLSACQTALTDYRRVPDEAVGLAAGFVRAGAPAVVSSLWAVDDLSTALLMGRFYREHLEQRLSPSQALRSAQDWLRTKVDWPLVSKSIESSLADLEIQRAQASPWSEEQAAIDRQMSQLQHQLWRLRRAKKREPGGKAFAHPYYWAAFMVSGADVYTVGEANRAC